MDIPIYHKPACGTPRNTLALIRAAGFAPSVTAYPNTPAGRDTIREKADASRRPILLLRPPMTGTVTREDSEGVQFG